MSALGFLIKKEFIQFRRNRFVSRLVFLLPIIVMLIVPLVANMDVKGVNVAVVDMDRSGLSGRMVSHLEASKQLRARLVVTDYRQAYDLLEAGKVDVIVTIPEGCEQTQMLGRMPEIKIDANAVNATRAALGRSMSLPPSRHY